MKELFDKYINEWIAQRVNQKGLSSVTMQKYKSNVLQFLMDANKEPLAIDLDDINDYVHAKRLNDLLPTSRQVMVTSIRDFFSFQVEKKRLTISPADRVYRPRAPELLPQGIMATDAAKVLNQCDLETFIGTRDAAIISLLGGCGLRLSGVASLNQSNIKQDIINGQSRLVLTVIEKGNKERLLVLPTECAIYLTHYLTHPDLKHYDRVIGKGDQVLWVSTMNRTTPKHELHGEKYRLSASSIYQMVVRYGKKAGLEGKNIHPHAYRHAMATNLIDNDVDAFTAQQILGHKDIQSTQRYISVAKRRVAQAIDEGNLWKNVNLPISNMARTLEKNNLK